MTEKLMNTNEAAELLSVSKSFLVADRMRKEGKVPYIKIGRCVRYRSTDILDIMKNGTPMNRNAA